MFPLRKRLGVGGESVSTCKILPETLAEEQWEQVGRNFIEDMKEAQK